MPKPLTPEQYVARNAAKSDDAPPAQAPPAARAGPARKPIPPMPSPEEVARRIALGQVCTAQAANGDCTICTRCGNRSCAGIAKSPFAAQCLAGKWL